MSNVILFDVSRRGRKAAKPEICLSTEVSDDRQAPSGNTLHKTNCETKPIKGD
jgi:hypothetical protein